MNNLTVSQYIKVFIPFCTLKHRHRQMHVVGSCMREYYTPPKDKAQHPLFADIRRYNI